MLIKENHGLHEKVVSYEYNPTSEELLYWYSGTNAGVDPKNPYARKHSLSVKRTEYIIKESEYDRQTTRAYP